MLLQGPLTAWGCLPGPARPSLLLCQTSCPAWSSGLCGCCEEGRMCLLLPITYFFKEGGSSSAWIPRANFPCYFYDLGDSMELGLWSSSRTFDLTAAVFLDCFMLASLALRWAKSFPSTGMQDGHVPSQYGGALRGHLWEHFPYPASVHVNNVLSGPSPCSEHQLCKDLWLFLCCYFLIKLWAWLPWIRWKWLSPTVSPTWPFFLLPHSFCLKLSL